MATDLDSISGASYDVAIRDASDSTDQFLTFMLAGEEYGVEILCVQEIRGWDSATKIPHMPAYVRGVINLRGNIVPIVDLRERFKFDVVDYSRTTVVIVLRVPHGESGDADFAMGLIVDAVSDVYRIGRDQLKPVPEFATGIDGEVARGVATIGEKMIIILDIKQLLSQDEMSIARTQSPPPQSQTAETAPQAQPEEVQ